MPAEDYRLYDEAYCNPIVIDVCDSQALGGYRYHTGPGMKGFGINFWWKLHPMVPLTLPLSGEYNIISNYRVFMLGPISVKTGDGCYCVSAHTSC